MTPAATETPARDALTAADRCDRCTAQAYVRVVLAGGGDLLFCGHHYDEHRERLSGLALDVDDYRDQLAAAR